MRILFLVVCYPEDVKCRLQIRLAVHCFTITESAQTFTNVLTLGFNTIFRPNVNISKGLGSPATSRVANHPCRGLIGSFSALTSLSEFCWERMSFVGISFYALSLLFGPCRWSEFTLSGPQICTPILSHTLWSLEETCKQLCPLNSSFPALDSSIDRIIPVLTPNFTIANIL